MLKGKIISITSLEIGKIKLIIDKKTKIFNNFQELDSFLIKTLEKARDPVKKALLKHDLTHYLHKM
jgi:hypothetical protein